MAKHVSEPAPNQINMIASGTVFDGTLRAESDVVVRGRIIGTLDVEGRAVVAPEGLVEGELRATEGDVSGTVHGDIEVQERLVLRSSARVDGNIKTGRLIVEEGATFNGECMMGQRSPALREAAVPVLSELS